MTTWGAPAPVAAVVVPAPPWCTTAGPRWNKFPQLHRQRHQRLDIAPRPDCRQQHAHENAPLIRPWLFRGLRVSNVSAVAFMSKVSICSDRNIRAAAPDDG